MRYTGIKRAVLLLLCANVALAVAAQDSGGFNVVGYYFLSVKPGDNLISNQFDDGLGNTLNDGQLMSGVLPGSTFTEWDPTAKQLLPVSIFDGQTWSINYTLAPDGVGGVLNSPDTASVFFVGSIINFLTDGPGYIFVPPDRDRGVYLLALAAPLVDETFPQIAGRNAKDGDAVETLNAATQQYNTTTFQNGSWNNGTPLLGVGEAAYFDLVPEPSTYALAGLAAMIFVASRKLRRAMPIQPKAASSL